MFLPFFDDNFFDRRNQNLDIIIDETYAGQTVKNYSPEVVAFYDFVYIPNIKDTFNTINNSIKFAVEAAPEN